MNSTKISYIYSLSSSLNEEYERYIGYSNNPKKRLVSHISESKNLKYRRHKWIQHELKMGNKIILRILRCGPEETIGDIETTIIPD